MRKAIIAILLILVNPLNAQDLPPAATEGPAPISADTIPMIPLKELPSERIRLRQWIAEGRAIMALPYLNSYLQQYPNNAALLLLKGEACFALERYETAVESFSQGVKIEPAKLGELFNYGRALQNLDRHDEALSVFQSMQARKEIPFQIRGLFGEGLTLQAQQKTKEARLKFEEVLTIDLQFDRARYRLAQTLMTDEPSRALELLDLVLRRDPLQHGAAYNRALVLRNLDRREEAQIAMARYQQILAGRSRIALLKERWALQPTEGPVLLELGRIHRDLFVYGEALRWFARAGAALPASAEPVLETVRTLLLAGRQLEARQLVQRLGNSDVALQAQRLIDDATTQEE